MAATDEKVKFQHERCWIYLVILMSRMKVKQQNIFQTSIQSPVLRDLFEGQCLNPQTLFLPLLVLLTV